MPAASPAVAAAIPNPAAAAPTQQPAPVINSGDTTVLNMPQMMPGQYPYQQMMPQMGYPGGMYGGYPYQQPMMPGYGQMYPQMMPPMIPQMGYPMQGGVMQIPQAAPEAAAAAAGPSVILPNPEDTGAKESDVAKGSSGASPKDTQKPTGAADAIIKQYMGRR
jgi:hypothetical protein